MAYSFKCRDNGFDEPFEIRDLNRDEMMKLITLHAQTTHNLKDVPADLKMKIEKAIKTV